MRKGTVLLKTGGVLLTMILIVASATGAVTMDRSMVDPPKRGAGLIMIDGLKSMGPLERPPVAFFHSRHTEALAKINRDCSACHLADEKKRLSPKFKRLADTDRQSVADTYHVNCIACHRELTGPDRRSGPLTCGGCHQENPNVASTWTAIDFDKSLHYRHVRANDEKCASCHHEYDPKTKQLVYVKGKEGACVYCHRQTASDDVMAREEASHFQCIGCHRSRKADNRTAGPVDCVGCHDADYQAGIEVLETVPRIQRNQPDVTLIGAGQENTLPPADDAPGMPSVPFDHLAHETNSASCKVCHHASLDACGSCHTSGGKPEGGMVKLSEAMHRVGARSSCIGCHQRAQEKPACVGCHAFMGVVETPREASCGQCHMPPLPPPAADDAASMPQTPTDVARRQLQSRDLTTKTFADDRMPETVRIGHLADQFEPAAFPHAKVVKALVDKTRNSRLAGYFHAEKGTLCQGCHHNSPAAQKPPQCASCHGRTAEDATAFKPGLVGAYHQQCIGCHTVMGLEKPAARDCNACHVEKMKK